MWLIGQLTLLAFLFLSGTTAAASEEGKTVTDRDGKFIPLFQVVKFANDFCTSSSTSRNGTCYTSSECSNLGGTSGSSCAEGFGVCCSFELTCGGSSSQNATYIINTSPTASCSYSICPSSSNICRVRFDFESFEISDPVLGTSTATATSVKTTNGGALGDCRTDQFSIDGPYRGSPVICGTNTGQHMILDSDGTTCHNVNVDIDTDATGLDRYAGGPPGCLQYFYDQGLSGTGYISNFGFDRSLTSVGTSVTHLSNQQYNICFRRLAGCHANCYTPAITISFGLSTSATDAIAQAGTNTYCTSDYLMIPGGSLYGTATLYQEATSSATVNPLINKACGRFIGTHKIIASKTVCTRVMPFVIGVVLNDDEVTGTADVDTNEQDTTPGGIVGFHLIYTQQC